MTSSEVMVYAGAGFSLLLGLGAFIRRRRSVAAISFLLGMAGLAAEGIIGQQLLQQTDPDKADRWLTWMLMVEALMPGLWLCFSLTYGRGNYREFLTGRWRILLAVAVVVPLGIALGFRDKLVLPLKEGGLAYGKSAKLLQVLLLAGSVLILMNLETTFRSAVGVMRWRVKFLIIGMGVLFGTQVYSLSQALLYSAFNPVSIQLHAIALLIACAMMTVAYMRGSVTELEIYPSHGLLQGSVTVVLVGCYLFVVGVLAQLVAHLGGAGSFQAQTFVVLLGLVGMAMLFFSERTRMAMRRFVSRHFKRPSYDSRAIWSQFSQQISRAVDQQSFSAAVAKCLSETFHALSVTLLLRDELQDTWMVTASTESSALPEEPLRGYPPTSLGKVGQSARPFLLAKADESWTTAMQALSPSKFELTPRRLCVPLVAADQWLGMAILTDRVGGNPYTEEELDLLKCMGDQAAAGLLNLRLTGDLVRAREMEAFQTMSTFFVHDMKNAASSLNLMLRNMKDHFDDAEFREDALRGIGKTADKINNLIKRLSALRETLDLNPVPCDLNQLVREALEQAGRAPGIEIATQLGELPLVRADPSHLQSVITNLILNARDALGSGGKISLGTEKLNGSALLTIRDNGCGMSAEFIRGSLFRPFQSTKKNGLGIGMYQSKLIVEAHQGTIQVESEPNVGTVFKVSLPLPPTQPVTQDSP